MRRLRLLSYNIHVGIKASRYRHYIVHSWKHILPFPQRIHNLNRIAGVIKDFDFAGLLELDSGSLRSGFINHSEYLASQAGFPHWYDATNRNLGKIARYSMGLLSRYESIGSRRYPLPGKVPGRGALMVYFGNPDDPLVLVLSHLSLGSRARMRQIEFIAGLIKGYNHVILMGDLNCGVDSEEIALLLEMTKLRMPYYNLLTYPSWKPRTHIDHILISPSISIDKVQILDCHFSDHLPIAMDVTLPDTIFDFDGSSPVEYGAA